jgi:hypothetical protein
VIDASLEIPDKVRDLQIKLYRKGVFSVHLVVNWTARWPNGRTGNTRSRAVIYCGRHIGLRASRVVIRGCSRTGRWACGAVPWREPFELRGSSTVLREPRGEIPRGYSPRDPQSWKSERVAGVDARSTGATEVTLNEQKTSIRNARKERFYFLGYTFGPHFSRRTGGSTSVIARRRRA